MDGDSSAKFIGSLTKFLQSLCNGYVEFQRGVELVGHIYLSIDTGEKVDYILHEKVNKGEENSVTFVSNSFHALPQDKDKNKASTGSSKTSNSKVTPEEEDDDDIMIVGQTENVPGSTNSGTIPSRGTKRPASPGYDQRRARGPLHRTHSSSSNLQSSPQRNRQQSAPTSTVSSQNLSQDNLGMGEVKLEQISSDELLSIASQVGDAASPHSMHGPRGSQAQMGSNSFPDPPGQQWVKQEPQDDSQRGLDTGWSQSDSSNSGSNLYPVMMHQSPAAFSSNAVFPGFSSSDPSASGFSHCGPGQSSSSNPYANPMPGTSHDMSGMDPSDLSRLDERAKKRESNQRYWDRLRQDPQRYHRIRQQQKEYKERRKRSRYYKHIWQTGSPQATCVLGGDGMMDKSNLVSVPARERRGQGNTPEMLSHVSEETIHNKYQ